MHYFWLKKKWFFDIITSNLLLALIVTATPPEINLDADCNYVYPVPFDANIVLEDLDSTLNSELAYTYEFTLELDIDSECNFRLKPYLIPTIPFGFVSTLEEEHLLTFDVELANAYDLAFGTAIEKDYTFVFEAELGHTYGFAFANYFVNDFVFDTRAALCNINETGINLAIGDEAVLALEADSAITSGLSFGTETILLDAELGFGSASALGFGFISTSEEVLDLLMGYELAPATRFAINLYFENEQNISLKYNFAYVSGLEFDVSEVEINVNTRFYLPHVLELKMLDIQMEDVDISIDVDEAMYITRFVDMQGWIVEDDLTGKKFKDLR